MPKKQVKQESVITTKNSGGKKGYNISNPVKGLKLNIRPIYG